MFKTLACLAGSMTCGAFLLAWLEPTASDYAAGRVDAGNMQTVQVMARRVVESAGLPGGRWNSIEVLPWAASASGSSAVLTATLAPKGVHFLVPSDGRLRCVPSWGDDSQPLANKHVIRVGVMTDNGSTGETLPMIQRLALRALLAELLEQTRSATGSLPVHVSEDAHGAGGASAAIERELHTLLAMAGNHGAGRLGGAPAVATSRR